MEIFGYVFKRKEKEEKAPSFVPKQTDDGAMVVTTAGGSYGTYVDLDGTVRSEAELVTKYRQMSLHPECDSAIDEIVNESISIDEENIVDINLDDVNLSDNLKTIIRQEFKNSLKIIDFNKYAYDIYRRWYIDGRLYYHAVIDEANPKDGIKELRYIDPRKIRKVREIQQSPIKGIQANVQSFTSKTVKEYFIYNDRGFNFNDRVVGPATTGLKISPDSIIHTVSGLTDTNGTMVLSYLHKAIKPLNQLGTLEDATVIYRISRAPERRIWYIDVGNLPKMKAEQYVREIMVKHKNRLIYDAASGEVRDDRKFMCYSMDTKIPLLDGRTLELQEIIKEYNEGKKNWVYSCDPKTGKFYPGPVSWAGITKQNADVVKVTFDNDKSVICTPDHKFPVWGKGFVEAQHLTSEDSIIPGYRRKKKIIENGAEYEQIFKNETGEWEFTHREVAAWKNENNIRDEFTFSEDFINESKNTIHHKNFNSEDNSPENLIMMNYKDHMLYHRNIQTILYTDSILKTVDYCASSLMSTGETIDYVNKNVNLIEWCDLNSNRNPKNRDVKSLTFNYKDLKRVLVILGKESWSTYCKSFDSRPRENNGRIKRGLTIKGSEEYKRVLSIASKNRKPIYKTWKVITPNNEIEIIENLSEYCRDNNLNRTNIKTKYGSKGYKAELLKNHRIKSVEFLSEKMTVGSMSIDAEETYHSHHTYLLDAGVYTKNTMLEDYWLPRREGGRGTEVTTLPGGQNLGQMDDVLYFQKKFLQSLNVPASRLNSDALFSIGRATEITRDELKFGRFIVRLRSRFSHLFYKILEKQLVLKGILTVDDWNRISAYIKFKFARDNYFTELKDIEIAQTRLSLANAYQGFSEKYYSHYWIRKNVLKQSEEDIKEQDFYINKENESQDPRWVNPAIEQNQQMTQPQDTGSADEDPFKNLDSTQKNEARERLSKIREAEITVSEMEKKKGNRSLQDEARYKSALQVVAKNKEWLKKMGFES
jgi:hypothetical protein